MPTSPERHTSDSSRGAKLADQEIIHRHRDSMIMELLPETIPPPGIATRRSGSPSFGRGESKAKLRQKSNYANLWNTLIEIMARSESRATARKSRAVKEALETKTNENKYLSYVEESTPFRSELEKQLEEVEQKEDNESILTQILATIVTLTSSLILSGTAIKRSLSHEGYVVEAPSISTQELEGLDPGKIGENLNHLLSMSNPSPVALGITMLAYGAGTSTIHHLNRNDRFQDAILIMGMALGLLVGTLVGHKFETIVLHVLPWAVFLALWLSALGHGIARAVAGKRGNFENESIV